MYIRILTLVGLSLALCGWGGINLGGGTPDPAGAGEDFTARATFLGCWAMGRTTSEADAEADNCTADSSTDTMTFASGIGFVSSTTVPGGTHADMTGFTLDGTNTWLTLADDDRFDPTAADVSFTIGCWVKPAQITNDVAMAKAQGGNDNYQLRVTGDTSFTGKVESVTETSATAPLDDGTWSHIALRYCSDSCTDATLNAVEVFYNGQEDCSPTCAAGPTGGTTGNAANLRIGADPGGSGDFEGSIMECWFVLEELLDIEIAEIFLCGLEGDATGTTRDSSFTGATCGDISSVCCS